MVYKAESTLIQKQGEGLADGDRQDVQRQYSLGGESSTSRPTTFVGMERPCRRIGPRTGTLAGLS